MYGRVETDASLRYLYSIIDELSTDYCLIGGWAVHFLANAAYEKEVGKPYLGSQDIDLGFPDVKAFRTAQSFFLEELRFERVSFRFLRVLDYDTGREMSREDATKTPMHMLIHMYIDAMLPFVGKKISRELGFTPPDEPLLDRVFGERGNIRHVRISGHDVSVPVPAVLLAMKLNSVGNRTKDHKRIKDLCDITALSLFSGEKINSVTEEALALCDPKKVKKSNKTVHRKDIIEAARTMDVSVDALVALMERLNVG
jgi:hypothetical protein